MAGRSSTKMSKDYLHLHLQFVLKDTVELLDVMLEEGIQTLPSERFGQLGGTCRAQTGIE